jgi:hypothetical protein
MGILSNKWGLGFSHRHELFYIIISILLIIIKSCVWLYYVFLYYILTICKPTRHVILQITMFHSSEITEIPRNRRKTELRLNEWKLLCIRSPWYTEFASIKKLCNCLLSSKICTPIIMVALLTATPWLRHFTKWQICFLESRKFGNPINNF